MTPLSLANAAVFMGREAPVVTASFVAEAGAITAIVGPNGAGKSTLLRAIAGAVPYEGEIRVFGRELSDLDAAERAKLIAYLPQTQSVAWPMSVRNVVGLGRLPHSSLLLDLTEKDEAAIESAIRRTGLGDLRDCRIDRLSQGERSRVLLARAIATEAPILLADEPIAALDLFYQRQIMDLLQEEARTGAAVLVVLHDLPLAATYARKIILIDKGHVVRSGAPHDVLTEKTILEVYRVRPASGELRLEAPFRIEEGEGTVEAARTQFLHGRLRR